jgi:hypothetical protein
MPLDSRRSCRSSFLRKPRRHVKIDEIAFTGTWRAQQDVSFRDVTMQNVCISTKRSMSWFGFQRSILEDGKILTRYLPLIAPSNPWAMSSKEVNAPSGLLRARTRRTCFRFSTLYRCPRISACGKVYPRIPHRAETPVSQTLYAKL